MLEFEIKVEGLAELQSQLNELKGPTVKRINNRGLRAAGAVLRADIQRRTPVRVDGPSSTALPPGAVKNDIRIKTYPSDNSSSSIVAVGPGKYTRRAMAWLEYGHRIVYGGYLKLLSNGKTRGKGIAGGFVPAYPVMRPAFEASAQEALEAYKASVTQSIANLNNKGGSNG